MNGTCGQHEALQQANIALVDDDGSVRKAMGRLLKSAGYRVSVFESARAFVESHYANETDCLILDMRMDGMSGADLQTYLAYQGARIPIVFISGYADESARKLVARQGAYAYLQKPVNDEQLLSTLDRALQEYDRTGED